MGSIEKLGVLVIIILVVVILVLTIWGVGVPPDELLADRVSTPTTLSAQERDRLSQEPPLENPLAAKDRESQKWPVDPVVLDPDKVDPPVIDPVEPDPEEPAFTEHVMKKDDTFYSLAILYFGDARQFIRIEKANPGLDPNTISVGTKIRIPDRESIQVEPPVPAPTPGEIYIVQEGDSLWKIALKTLGSGTHFKKIHEANRDVIGNEAGNLKIGMKLRIPR